MMGFVSGDAVINSLCFFVAVAKLRVFFELLMVMHVHHLFQFLDVGFSIIHQIKYTPTSVPDFFRYSTIIVLNKCKPRYRYLVSTVLAVAWKLELQYIALSAILLPE